MQTHPVHLVNTLVHVQSMRSRTRRALRPANEARVRDLLVRLDTLLGDMRESCVERQLQVQRTPDGKPQLAENGSQVLAIASYFNAVCNIGVLQRLVRVRARL